MKNKIILIIVGVFIVIALISIAGFFSAARTSSQKSEDLQENGENAIDLQPQTNDEGGVSITVDPGDFDLKNPQFQISFETHQGDLDFDLTRIAVLIVDGKKEYPPLRWEGGQGGHHISGVLSFPAINKGVKNINLIIKDVYGVEEREFFWTLP